MDFKKLVLVAKTNLPLCYLDVELMFRLQYEVLHPQFLVFSSNTNEAVDEAGR